MNDKNIEEKAKEYAENKVYSLELQDVRKYVDDFHLRNETYDSYTVGYTQAVTNQHSKMTFLELELDIKNQDNAALLKQLTQYKEALRESTFLLARFGEDELKDHYHMYKEQIEQNKQLLNNE